LRGIYSDPMAGWTTSVGSWLLGMALALGAGASPARAAADPSASAAAATPLGGATITIDPGHNGGNASHPEEINRQVSIGGGETKECDTTGTATSSGYPESRFNLSVARKLKRQLRARGAEVVLTRKNDRGVGPCIDERARIGNRAHSDAAISIHADGGPPDGRGFHVIYPTKIRGLTDDIYRDSRRLARRIRSSYERRTGMPRASYIGSDGLDKRSDLGGLRLSNVPKVFIETGNMRNRVDARKLSSSRFRARIARGLREGLARFLQR
jgi:N-acetylmuramoyl-L-alanine amidase